MNYYLRAELFSSAFFLYKIFFKALTILIISIFLNNCSNPDKVYEVKGTIHEINLDENEVVISHDTIQGLMYPMIMPFTLADAVTEVQTEAFLEDPLGAVFAVDVTELLSNFSELGMDMTDDQREKAQEVVVPVIIVSQIASAMIGMRR